MDATTTYNIFLLCFNVLAVLFAGGYYLLRRVENASRDITNSLDGVSRSVDSVNPMRASSLIRTLGYVIMNTAVALAVANIIRLIFEQFKMVHVLPKVRSLESFQDLLDNHTMVRRSTLQFADYFSGLVALMMAPFLVTQDFSYVNYCWTKVCRMMSYISAVLSICSSLFQTSGIDTNDLTEYIDSIVRNLRAGLVSPFNYMKAPAADIELKNISSSSSSPIKPDSEMYVKQHMAANGIHAQSVDKLKQDQYVEKYLEESRKTYDLEFKKQFEAAKGLGGEIPVHNFNEGFFADKAIAEFRKLNGPVDMIYNEYNDQAPRKRFYYLLVAVVFAVVIALAKVLYDYYRNKSRVYAVVWKKSGWLFISSDNCLVSFPGKQCEYIFNDDESASHHGEFTTEFGVPIEALKFSLNCAKRLYLKTYKPYEATYALRKNKDKTKWLAYDKDRKQCDLDALRKSNEELVFSFRNDEDLQDYADEYVTHHYGGGNISYETPEKPTDKYDFGKHAPFADGSGRGGFNESIVKDGADVEAIKVSTDAPAEAAPAVKQINGKSTVCHEKGCKCPLYHPNKKPNKAKKETTTVNGHYDPALLQRQIMKVNCGESNACATMVGGVLLTNYHVCFDQSDKPFSPKIHVSGENIEKDLPLPIKSFDKLADLMAFYCEVPNLKSMKIGKEPKIGDPVFARYYNYKESKWVQSNGNIIALDSKTLTYDISTMAGACGAAICNSEGQVLAIHQLGADNMHCNSGIRITYDVLAKLLDRPKNI